MGVRERKSAPVLRGGLEDARLRDGRAVGLGAPGSGGRADRVGLALHQGWRGFTEWLDAGLVAGELPAFNGAQATGCSPVATAFAEGWDVCRPQKPNTIAKSLAIGDPAECPYALELARNTGGAIDSVTEDEIRAGIRLLAETTGIFTETAGGVTIATLVKLAERGAVDRSERVVAYITGDGLKTLDAVRDGFRITIDPSVDALDAELAGAGAPAAR